MNLDDLRHVFRRSLDRDSPRLSKLGFSFKGCVFLTSQAHLGIATPNRLPRSFCCVYKCSPSLCLRCCERPQSSSLVGRGGQVIFPWISFFEFHNHDRDLESIPTEQIHTQKCQDWFGQPARFVWVDVQAKLLILNLVVRNFDALGPDRTLVSYDSDLA